MIPVYVPRTDSCQDAAGQGRNPSSSLFVQHAMFGFLPQNEDSCLQPHQSKYLLNVTCSSRTESREKRLSRLIKAFVSDALACESAASLCWDVVFTLKSHQWVFSGCRPPSFKCCNRNKCVGKPDHALQRTSGFHSVQIQFSPMEFRFQLIKIYAQNSIRSKDVVVEHFIFKKIKIKIKKILLLGVFCAGRVSICLQMCFKCESPCVLISSVH